MSKRNIVAVCLVLLAGCNGESSPSDSTFGPINPDPPVIVDPPEPKPEPEPEPEPPIIIVPSACMYEVEPNGGLGVGPTFAVQPGFFQSFCGQLTFGAPNGWDVDAINFSFPDNTYGNGLILSITIIGEFDSGIEVFVQQWDFNPPPPQQAYSHNITHGMPNGGGITIVTNVQVPYHHNGFQVSIRNLASPQTQYQMSIGVVGVIP